MENKIILLWLIAVSIICILNFISCKSQNKMSKETKENVQKFIKGKYNIDMDEYIHSLDFNSILDSHILSLLGKFSNEDIVNKVTDKLILLNDNFANINEHDKIKLKEYIRDVLRNYNNSYEEPLKNKDINKEFDELFESSPNSYSVQSIDFNKEGTETIDKNRTNITNVLNNFYKD